MLRNEEDFTDWYLEVSRDPKNKPARPCRRITQYICLPLVAIVQPKHRLRRWPETHGRHNAPYVVRNIPACCREFPHIPIHVFKTAGKVKRSFFPSQQI